MDNISNKLKTWDKAKTKVFWGEIAACEHVAQIYENDDAFLSTLEDFVCGGINSGDAVVIIATADHLTSLNTRLIKREYDISELISNEQYFPLEANAMLEKFMVNHWPDAKLFNECINELISKATKHNKNVRAFGEMVAILWSEGRNGATVQLEELWRQLHSKNRFTLYCAYPKSGFTQNPSESIEKICGLHSKIIDVPNSSSQEIYYINSL